MFQRLSTAELRNSVLDVLAAEGPIAYPDAIAILNRAGLSAGIGELRAMKYAGALDMRLEPDGEGGFVHVVEVVANG